MPATAEAVTPQARTRYDGQPAVEVRDLRKEFRRRIRTGKKGHRRMAALDGVTFTIERGECVAILGQNGSGKSTLVRLLSTLLLSDGGSARVFGHDVFAEPRPVQKLVNRVSVEASFFKKMSAAENLGYAARFYGMGPGETRDEIPRILGRVGFPPERRGEPMENLSRGMQQKVALARALLTSPVLLLLDEPTTGLDPQVRHAIWSSLRELAAQGLTILLTTHYMEEAAQLADRVGILDRGRLIAEGAPAALVAEHLPAYVLELPGSRQPDERWRELGTQAQLEEHGDRVRDVDQVVRDAAALLDRELVGADIEAPIHRRRIAVDDLAIDSQGDFDSERAFA